MGMDSIRQKLAELQIEKRAFINGRFVTAPHGQTLKKFSSIDGRPLEGLVACQAEDVEAAVLAARAAYASRIWRDRDPAEKKAVLLGLADLMEEHRLELALLDTLETGRSIKNYYEDSIPKAIEALRWFAEGVDKVYDHAIPPRRNAFATITREPLGVVGLITPWNDPLVVSIWKLAPALLMGNSVVFKPAEWSSFSILLVAKLAAQAGIPPGVFNVVPGEGEVAGKALALHPQVDGIFFTGSSQVGKLILQYAGQSNMKKVGLECGGKSPFLISQQCSDLTRAAAVLAKNIFYNQGQICSAPSRLLIHEKIKDAFLERLVEEAARFLPSDPLDMSSEVGRLVSAGQKQRVQEYIAKGIAQGGQIVFGTAHLPEGITCCSPTIFDHVDPHAAIWREEIFGPVLVVRSVASMQEAVTLANDSPYGLAASIWTDDLNEAYHISRLLEAGIVHINCYGDDDNTVPFGGFKQSGLGKDKSLYAFDEYSQLKTIWIHLKDL
ncbi:MAG: aldehyde dehydrogenase family protein [Magnetococcales bacterium]|nr:aldehyde dehydrogenase family protein [Magnetococcales bacterium]